jgi:hypothetical protein
LRLANYSLNEVLSLLSIKVEYSDWLPMAEKKQMSDEYHVGLAVVHTIQFMATYREYNLGVISDEMFCDGGWTNKWKELISNTWNGEQTKLEQSYKLILCPAFDLHEWLRVNALNYPDLPVHESCSGS